MLDRSLDRAVEAFRSFGLVVMSSDSANSARAASGRRPVVAAVPEARPGVSVIPGMDAGVIRRSLWDPAGLDSVPG